MARSSSLLRMATGVAQGLVILSGAIIALGVVLPPWWPLAFNLHMGRPSPIENFIQVVFDYPMGEPFLYAVMPLHEWVVTCLPLVVQFILVLTCTFLLARLLRQVTRDGAYAARSWRTLGTLGIVGLVGAVLQFGVGILSWIFGRRWTEPADHWTAYDVAIHNQFPFPQWPLTFLFIGIVATALSVAFRAGARMEQELKGVV